MRKSKSQQKNEASQQLNLFSWQAGELTGTPAGGNSTGSLPRVELLSLLEKQRTLTDNLLERIVDYENTLWFSRQWQLSLYLRIKV